MLTNLDKTHRHCIESINGLQALNVAHQQFFNSQPISFVCEYGLNLTITGNMFDLFNNFFVKRMGVLVSKRMKL